MRHAHNCLTHANLLEELGNVVQNQPLWPGDTVSHAGAAELCRLGLIRRTNDGKGYWVPTETGLQVHRSGSFQA